MKWGKFKQDLGFVLFGPFVALAYLSAAVIYVFLGWVPAVVGVPLVRYSDSDTLQAIGKTCTFVSFLWLFVATEGEYE